MLNTIITVVITSVTTTLLGCIALFYNREKARTEGIKCLLRAGIVNQYYEYYDKQCIPFYKKEAIAKEYEAYKVLGGNSFIEDMMNEINTWRVG